MARQIDTIANRITLEGGAEILKFLDSLGKEGEESAKQLREAFAKTGFDKRVTDGVKNIQRSFLGLGNTFTQTAGKLNPLRTALIGLQSLVGGLFRGAGIGGGLASGGILAALTAITLAAGKNAAALKDQANQFGISTDALQKYQNVATEAGVPVDNLSGFLTTLSDKIGDNTKKVKQSTQEFEVFGEGAEGAAKKTVKVIQGVRGFADEAGKLQKSLDFKVPTEGLGKVEERTVTVRRGVQNVNEELEKTSVLFRGITEEQFRTGEAFDIISRRLEGVTNKVQALRDAGVPRSQAGGFADFLTANLERLKAVETQAGKTGEAIRDGFVRELGKDEIEDLSNMNEELNKLTSNLSKLFSRTAATNADLLGSALEAINSHLEEIDERSRKVGGSITNLADLDRVARQISQTLETGGPGAGRSALFTGLVDGAADADVAIEDLKKKVVEFLSTLNGLGGGGPAAAGGAVNEAVGEAVTPLLESIGEDIEAAKISISEFFGQIQTEGTAALTETFAFLTSDEFTSQLEQGAQTALDTIRSIFNGSALADIAQALAPAFESAWATVVSAARQAFQAIQGIISQIIAAVRDAVSAVQNLRDSASDGGGSSGGGGGGFGGSGFASGGRLSGPGGPRGDRIPLWGSDGEFMIQTAAARKVGYGFLQLLNSGRYSLAQLFEMLNAGRYAGGGLISALERSFPAPRFATGGAISAPARAGGRPFILQLPGGQQIEVGTANESAIGQLNRATTRGKLLTTRRRLL